MDTPLIKLTDKDLESVYEPSEDSYLLIDALEADLEILKSLKPLICLEIGSGSGIVITALGKALIKHFKTCLMAVDINPEACKVTKRISRDNSIDIDVMRMNLVDCFKKNLTYFDVIVFNPPYVVTESLEINDERLIFKTWAGGIDGREVMDKLFSHIPNILSDKGFFYLVTIKENDPNSIIDLFDGFNMNGKIVLDRKVRGEHLHILRFTKKINKQ